MSSRVGAAGAGRALAALVAVAAVATGAAHAARADGDPASDYLLLQNVYFPMQAPSAGAESALEQAVDAVYAHGDRVKVALVYSAQDLGAIPSLYGKPSDYARFLGTELGLWYVGPLLVVMPAGYGIYDGGRSVAPEQQVLADLPLAESSSEQLTRSATGALQRLEAAGVLRSADIRAPLVTAHPATAKRGRPANLRFDVFDDSGRSAETVRVYEAGARVATLRSPMAFGIGTRHVVVHWLVPRTLRSRTLRFCVVAVDPAGNDSAPACAPFLRVS